MEKCGDASPEGARCIMTAGHDGRHEGKSRDGFEMPSWDSAPQPDDEDEDEERKIEDDSDWQHYYGLALMSLSGRTEDLEVAELEATEIATSAGLIADAAVAEVERRKEQGA